VVPGPEGSGHPPCFEWVVCATIGH
jgi:hypothetical protein